MGGNDQRSGEPLRDPVRIPGGTHVRISPDCPNAARGKLGLVWRVQQPVDGTSDHFVIVDGTVRRIGRDWLAIEQRESEPSRADVVQINMQTPAGPVVRGHHVHACPSCFEKVPCNDACSIETDLFREGETPCGAHATCDACAAKQRGSEPLRGVDLFGSASSQGRYVEWTCTAVDAQAARDFLMSFTRGRFTAVNEEELTHVIARARAEGVKDAQVVKAERGAASPEEPARDDDPCKDKRRGAQPGASASPATPPTEQRRQKPLSGDDAKKAARAWALDKWPLHLGQKERVGSDVETERLWSEVAFEAGACWVLNEQRCAEPLRAASHQQREEP